MEGAILIYFIIGCISLVLALISFLFAEIGDVFHDVTGPIGDWADSHISFGHDHEVGFSKFLNNGGILGFLAGFGFIAALTMSQFKATPFAAALWGVLGGLVLGSLVGAFWYGLKKSEGTAGYNIKQLVGCAAIVSEKIFQGSMGKVTCEVNGIQTWQVAKSENGSEIAVGVPVKIIGVTGNVLAVVPKENKQEGGR